MMLSYFLSLVSMLRSVEAIETSLFRSASSGAMQRQARIADLMSRTADSQDLLVVQNYA